MRARITVHQPRVAAVRAGLLFSGGLGDHGLAAILAATHAHAVRDLGRATVGASLNRRAVLTGLLHPRGALLGGAGWAATSFLQCHGKLRAEHERPEDPVRREEALCQVRRVISSP